MINKQRKELAQQQAHDSFNKAISKITELDGFIAENENYFYIKHSVLGLVISDKEGNLYEPA